MNFIEFLFKLISHFVAMEPTRKANLENEAQKWLDANKDKSNVWGKLIAYQNLWFVQLALMFVLLFSIKAISRWMVSEPTKEEGDDDVDDEFNDEDAYNQFLQSRRTKPTFSKL